MKATPNPEMIVLAREARRLTQHQLARELKISQAKISKIESGLVPVSDELLRALVVTLRYPEEFFYQQDRRFGVGVSEYFHRKKSSLGVRTLDAIHADVEMRRLHVSKLVRAVEIDQVRPLPKLNLEDFEGDAAEAARVLRATWKLPSGPIKNLSLAVEESGGLILRCDFGTSLVDGMSRYLADLPPMFFLNARLPGDRYRFTLAHELGHIVLHDFPNPEMEEQANTFAAELLMPAADISSSLSGLTWPKLATLKQIWKVSMAALLKRAADLGKITKRHERTLWIQMGKLGYRSREPEELDIPQEEPALLQELLDYHTGELGYSTAELSKMMCWQEEEVQRVYALSLPTKAKLRLV